MKKMIQDTQQSIYFGVFQREFLVYTQPLVYSTEELLGEYKSSNYILDRVNEALKKGAKIVEIATVAESVSVGGESYQERKGNVYTIL